jgi:hypothetical protein
MLKDELLGTAEWVHAAVSSEACGLYCRAAQIASVPAETDTWMAKIVTLPSRVVSVINVLQESGCDLFGRAGNGVLYVRPSSSALAVVQPASESDGIGLMQSLTADGAGSIEILKSVAGRPVQSLPPVQEISRKLRELLG